MIFEFKVVEDEKVTQPSGLTGDGHNRDDCDTGNRNTALEQIKNRKYYEKYLTSGKGIYLIGIEFSKEERNIVKFDWELVKI